MPHARFKILSADALREAAKSATHKLVPGSIRPSPQPKTAAQNRQASSLPRFKPAIPTAMKMNPNASVRPYPRREINVPSDAIPIRFPQNCIVKKSPARSSVNDQREIRNGRIGPKIVVTTPARTKPKWIRVFAAFSRDNSGLVVLTGGMDSKSHCGSDCSRFLARPPTCRHRSRITGAKLDERQLCKLALPRRAGERLTCVRQIQVR